MGDLIAVTGASGALGGRVARRLADTGADIRLVVRDAARAPAIDGAQIAVASGYEDRDGLTEALRGAETVFLVSARESIDRVSVHRTAVDAAVAAGVRRIVYTSFLGAAPDAVFTFARDHFATEQHIRGTGLEHTFLRDSMYAEYVPLMASADGVIRGPAGAGRTAWVSRDDVADAAVAVLTTDGHDGYTYELTGPEAHSFSWAAGQLTEITGRLVVFQDETVEEAYATRAVYDAPAFEVDGWVTSYTAVAAGEMDVVTDAVERLTGRRAQRLPEVLAAHPGSWAHLRVS
ncbi:MAG: NAD(P)H-binding protein [Solirubrobacteraceae bacterium]|nr:NAD(P)H-binding protein [Solirubrobacteraceae bacterium]